MAKMENALVSVCISAFNEEKRLRKSLNSILVQNIEALEIILVDDGSTDGTLRIMQEYQRCYPKIIRIIQQEHKGLAQGRWTGVKNSTGKYVTFLDADDYLLDESYKTIIEFMSNHDADIYEFQTIRDGYYSKSPYSGIMDAKQVLKDYFNGVGMPVNYWLRWFKSDLFTEKIFPVGISLHEDVYAFPCILNNAETIAYIEQPLHVHTRDNHSSIMREHYEDRKGRDFFERQKTLLLSIPHIINCIGEKKIEVDYKLPFQHFVSRTYLNFLFLNVRDVTYEEKQNAIISTLNLPFSCKELEQYIKQNLDLNCKMNYAIRWLGPRNAYLLNNLRNRVRI